MWTFDVYPLNLILVSWDGLHSFQEKRCQKSIKQYFFVWNEAVEVIEAAEAVEAAKVIEALYLTNQ